ncbi:hypothetical protein [Burkholderia pyrrocinia]|uniref:hypothetical protein n=2 Tax=Burkholderia TaxID=32008 RepID=UPI0011604E71|nr:hypothetical protein [Burkholderia pyrrocinia]
MSRMLAPQRFRGACVGWPRRRFITDVLKNVSADCFDAPVARRVRISFAAHRDDECARDVDETGRHPSMNGGLYNGNESQRESVQSYWIRRPVTLSLVCAAP